MRTLLDNLGSVTDGSTGECWSSRRLADESFRRAKILRAKGIGPGDKVLIGHGNTAEFFADLFAVWNVGACAACLNPGIKPLELKNIAEFLSPKSLLLASDQELPNGLGVEALILGDLDGTDIVEGPSLASHQDDDALILFTSGTTGTPKGVVHSFRSLQGRLALNQAYIPESHRKITLCPLPTHFGHGLIGNCLTALTAGNDIILIKGGEFRTAAALGAIIDKYGVTFMSSVPAHWKMALKASKPPEKGTLKRVHIGSAPLSSDLWQNVMKWSGTDEVFNMYGITETCNWIGGASGADHEVVDGLIGQLWGGSAAVMTEEGEIKAVGEGEIIVQTPSLMVGYYKLAELTDAVLKDGWFYTGDIGRIDQNGVMRLTGRKKFEINRAGLKVHPEDIDVLLERNPSVREACAFGVPDDIAGETVGVAVCFVDENGSDLKALKLWCAEHIVREKVPEKWYVLSDIPKTDRGKINRDNVASVCIEQGQS